MNIYHKINYNRLIQRKLYERKLKIEEQIKDLELMNILLEEEGKKVKGTQIEKADVGDIGEV